MRIITFSRSIFYGVSVNGDWPKSFSHNVKKFDLSGLLENPYCYIYTVIRDDLHNIMFSYFSITSGFRTFVERVVRNSIEIANNSVKYIFLLTVRHFNLDIPII